MIEYTDKQLLAAIKKHGSGRKAAKALGIPRTSMQDRVAAAKKEKFSTKQRLRRVKISAPKRGGTKRFIFSSAQDGTKVHEGFLANLEAYAEFMDAEIHIGGFTYNKSLFEDHSNKRATFHPLVEKYMTNNQFDVAGKLLFCGEINTSPTAVTPLSGFETYTRGKWGIFPHPRVTLQSVATMFHQPSKQIMTTGAVTLPNYIAKKAGIKAEFHHVIGAVIVEVDGDGDVFCRHLIAEKDGSFQDLGNYVSEGSVEEDASVEAITWGDVHTEQLDPAVKEAAWGPEGMLDRLMPEYQFFHDVLDFQARNHHNLKDPHYQFEMFLKGIDSVEDAIKRVGDFLVETKRDWCQSIVVESNHDRMLMRWLKEADYRADPINAEFFLECQLKVYNAIRQRDDHYLLIEDILNDRFAMGGVVFLREDDSMTICGNTIECALHGHKGANGAKGHIGAYARMGPKANIGHTHSAAIFEGIYQAGTSSKLDLGYNRGGLSSWNHSHIITYPNGKRTIVTMQNGKFCA
jgi:hypothetical protein